ncbi:MAG TPA: aminoglycoside 6'-N-acetyltransferase [Pyrinomonadaceae bacterium]|jgi:aminoglycoside 6'-N-acetyltransferase I|nr:aminoglycoside 6'-N-acetyltransferase [Pyrinomonadaceae bacterium]
MAAPEIRPVTENDLDDWFRLRKQLWDQITDEEHHGEMLDILEHSDAQLVLVADVGNRRLAGFLEASIRPYVEDCHTDHVGYLEGWYVDPEHRKQGIGRALVEAAEDWAFEKGCTEMASDAELGNEVSLAAHRGLGYAETSRLVHLRKELE